jgi:putative ABC transport system permease protein
MLVILLVLFVLPDLVFALSFVGTVLGLLLMLEGIVRLIRHAALAMDNRRHFALHLALANMHRHGSALRVSLLTLGSALTLLVACTVLITSLLDTIAGTIPEESPDLVLYDIAPYQQKEVEQILVAAGASRIDMAPLVQGRIAALNGRSATMESSLEEQRESRDEHKLTYRADNLDGVTMVRGNWWPSDIVDDRAYVVMEDREADQIGLNVGDILTFNIEGRELEAQLTGIYQQQGLQTRFWFEAILSDGVLDPFISRYVAASYLPGDSAIAAQSEIASTAPSVVSVRTATIVATAKDLLGKAVVGLAMVSGVAFSVSLLVLTGVMASHRSRQVYYSTILHTIGARLSVIRLSLGMEYLLLALVTSVFALVLGILIALPMLHFQLRLPLTFPVWPPVIAAFGVSSVCLYGGASYLMRRLKLQPASLLRGH